MNRLSAIAVFSAVIVWITAANAASVNNNAYLYEGPGYNYAKLLTMPRGANFAIGECRSQWCQAIYGGQGGFIHQSFVVGGAYVDKPPCRGGPSKCKDSRLSIYTFSLGSASRAANRSRRGGGNNEPGSFLVFPIFE